MKIMLLNELGSFNRITVKVLSALQSLGVDPTFVCLREKGELNRTLSEIGIPNDYMNSGRFYTYPGTIIRLARLIQREKFDVIHSAEAISAAIGGMAGLLAGRGVRIFDRQHIKHEEPSARQQQAFTMIGHKVNQFVMACSQAAKSAAISDGFDPTRVFVAYNGADQFRDVTVEEITAKKRELGIGADEVVVVILSRLRKAKGHETLFAAFPEIAAKVRKPVRIIVVGSGPDREELIKAAGEVEPGRIIFVGFQEDVSLWFGLADVVAMPSYVEAFGYAAVEAMAGGKPVVASRVGGLPEIITDGEDGLLVEPGNATELARGLIRILEDDDTAKRLGENARRTAETRFSIEAMASNWLASYDRAVRMSS